MPLARCGAGLRDARGGLGQRAAVQHLAVHAQVSTPPDVQAVEGSSVKLHCPSSITTAVSTPGGQPCSRSWRPVVTTKGWPMPLSAIACAAHSTCMELMPATTRTLCGAGCMRAAMRSVLSYSAGSPQTSRATCKGWPGVRGCSPSSRDRVMAACQQRVMAACHSSTWAR